MSVETHRVLMGTCGWKHQAWLNDFYSEDLPEEWQLGFYSNEFPVVYVPASDWIDVTDIAEWTEDVSDSFRFILEVPENVLKDEEYFVTAISKAKTLGEFCLGLVFQLTPELCDDIQLIQKRLDVAQAVAPVCIEKCGTPFTTEFEQFLQKQNITEVWNGQEEKNKGATCGSLSISRILGNKLDMAGLRKVVEVCLSESSEDCISVLCLEGEPPSLEQLRNADTILNLL
jgi:uncharacterized protein YecE (DUF72 family)